MPQPIVKVASVTAPPDVRRSSRLNSRVVIVVWMLRTCALLVAIAVLFGDVGRSYGNESGFGAGVACRYRPDV